jgi:hypothetical protein
MKEQIIKLWNEGLSSGLIAQKLKLTRNQVMGCIHRAQKTGLAKKRAEPKQRLENPIHKPKPKAVPLETRNNLLRPVFRPVETPVEEPKPIVVPPKPEVKRGTPKTILELGVFDCRYIIENGKYCGEFTDNYRQPWCPEHRKLVYVPVKKRA